MSFDQEPPGNPNLPEKPNNPERPGGKISVLVSQPDLLFQLAIERPTLREHSVRLNLERPEDGFLQHLEIEINRTEKDSKYSPTWSYQTVLRLSREETGKSHQGYYSNERANTVIANLKALGLNADKDNAVNGQQRVKITAPSGKFGVEMFLGWSDSEAYQRYAENGRAIHQNVSEETLNFMYPKQIGPNDHISIGLVNKNRLDTADQWHVSPDPPKNYNDFQEQTEFYRKTLETLLIALYRESGITPNLELVIRPPIRSEDKLTELSSVSGRVTQEVKPEQMVTETVTLADIKGQPEAVKEARRLVRAINEPERYQEKGIKPPKGVLFVGPPGTGKTMLAKGIATEANADFISINAAKVGSKYINESARLMNELFDDAENRAQTGKKVIIFIDEIDSLAISREFAHPEDIKAISVMLDRLDGIATLPGVTLLAATNRLDAIDSAIVRPGRIDKIVNVGLPQAEGRREVLHTYMDKARQKAAPQFKDNLFETGLNVEELVAESEQMSPAELEVLINRALEVNLDDELDSGQWRPVSLVDLKLLIPAVKKETVQKRTIQKPPMGFPRSA